MAEHKHVKDRWFNKIGVAAQYFDGNLTIYDFPAILQPLRYKNKMYLNGSHTEIGFEGRRQFLLLCPAGVKLEGYHRPEAMVVMGGYRYIVDRAEAFYVGDKVVYNWAIIHRGVKQSEPFV